MYNNYVRHVALALVRIIGFASRLEKLKKTNLAGPRNSSRLEKKRKNRDPRNHAQMDYIQFQVFSNRLEKTQIVQRSIVSEMSGFWGVFEAEFRGRSRILSLSTRLGQKKNLYGEQGWP